jgi:hypothetical protein
MVDMTTRNPNAELGSHPLLTGLQSEGNKVLDDERCRSEKNSAFFILSLLILVYHPVS